MRLEDMSFYDYLVAECEYKEKQRRKKREMRDDELLLNERVNNAVNAVLEQIRAEIEQMETLVTKFEVLDLIDKHIKGVSE